MHASHPRWMRGARSRLRRGAYRAMLAVVYRSISNEGLYMCPLLHGPKILLVDTLHFGLQGAVRLLVKKEADRAFPPRQLVVECWRGPFAQPPLHGRPGQKNREGCGNSRHQVA